MKTTFPLILWILLIVNASFTQPQIKWVFNTDDSAFGQSAMSDLDGDGKYEVVFGCYRNDSMVYALNADDGTLLWMYNASTANAEGCNDTAPLIYDVDDDGTPDVIVASSCNPTTFCFDGKTGEIKWQIRTRGSDSPPTIADLDDDGNLEILHGEMGGYVKCINAIDGTLNWDLEVDLRSWVQTAPSIVDLDNDGLPDFVVATWNFDKASKVFAYRGYDRKLLWQRDVGDYVYHGFAVSDIDKDGKDEIMFGDYSGNFWVLNAEDGEIKWTFKSQYYVGSPAVTGDITGDGLSEVIVSSYFKVYAFRHDGSILWEYDTPGYGQSFRGVALSDMDESGLPDVVFGTSKGHLIALSGMTGKQLWIMNLADSLGLELDFSHAPVIGDMDGNGKKDIFLVGGKTEMPDFTSNYGRAVCVSTDVKAGDEWLMFQGNVERTGNNYKKEVNRLKQVSKNDNFYFDNINNYVIISKLKINSEIMIYDLLGNLVWKNSAKDDNIRINVGFLPVGVFFVIAGENSYKFIKS